MRLYDTGLRRPAVALRADFFDEVSRCATRFGPLKGTPGFLCFGSTPCWRTFVACTLWILLNVGLSVRFELTSEPEIGSWPPSYGRGYAPQPPLGCIVPLRRLRDISRLREISR